MTAEPLVCPTCALAHAPDERFCQRCGMPLVHAGSVGVDQAVTELQQRARKIKPQYADGDLVRVVGAGNQAEAEFIQGLLLEEGIPSLIKRSLGFDVPDMLAAGGRDLLVPRSGFAAARDVLLQAEILRAGAVPSAVDRPLLILVGLLAAIAVVGLVLWLGAGLR